MFGRKLFYMIGISIFLIGSALCGTAQDMTQLIVFRAIQGIGSGAIFPISFTIIYTIFADPKQAAKLSGCIRRDIRTIFCSGTARSVHCWLNHGAGAGVFM